MEYNDVKQCVLGCPDLAGLPESATAGLFLHCEVQTLAEGEIIYAEGAMLDNTFCVVVSGDLVVERAAEVVGGILQGEIFGEMAYFTNRKARTATVYVGSPQAVVLRFQLTPGELATARFSDLRKLLGLQTWEKFVSASQGPIRCQSASEPAP